MYIIKEIGLGIIMCVIIILIAIFLGWIVSNFANFVISITIIVCLLVVVFQITKE